MQQASYRKILYIAMMLTFLGWAFISIQHVLWRNAGFVQLNFGLVRQEERLLEKAESNFTQALNIEVQDQSSLRGLGGVLLSKGNLDQVIYLWQNSLPLAEMVLAHCYLSHDKQDDLALRWCQAAIGLNSQNADAWYLLGIAYTQNLLWLEALDAFSQASLFGNLTVSGGSNPFFKVGMINQWRLQKLDDALAAYDRAIGFDDFALDSEAAEAYYRRAEVLMWQGYGPGYLIEDLETAVALDPTYVQAHIMLAVVQYKHDGDLASAEANIQRVLALDPNNASAYLHLGDIYALAGMGEHASNMYEAALALAPDLHNEITERQNNLQDN